MLWGRKTVIRFVMKIIFLVLMSGAALLRNCSENIFPRVAYTYELDRTAWQLVGRNVHHRPGEGQAKLPRSAHDGGILRARFDKKRPQDNPIRVKLLLRRICARRIVR